MRKTLFSAAAILGLFSTHSLAADLPVETLPAPVSPVVFDWTGGYLGASLGYGAADLEGIEDSGDCDTNCINLGRFDPNGATGAFHIGYNYQFNNGFTLGAEGDWSFMDWNDRLRDPVGEDAPLDFASIQIRWIATLRARLGFAFDRTHIYATGGAAWNDAEYTGFDGGSLTRGKKTFGSAGYVIGAGLEHMFWENFSLRAEGLYHGWNDRKSLAGNNPDNEASDFVKLNDSWIVRVGGSYHFGPR